MQLHTIILLCGPSCCGKTFYAKNHLIPGLKRLAGGFPLNIQYLSSDDLRLEILGDPAMNLRDQGNSQRLRFTSQAAFRRLEFQLEQVTAFPVNAEFVIVDTTALDADFRNAMIAIARKNHYNIDLVLFDLPTREYNRYAGGAGYVRDHVRRLRTEVFPNLGSAQYGQVVRVRDRENPPAVEAIDDFSLYRRCHYADTAAIVGDIHGCLDALLEIEKAAGNLPLIVLGDVIDKGPDSLGVLRHMRANPARYPLFVLGNHERYVHRYLAGENKESPAHDYYTSIPQYAGNAEFAELVAWYVAEAVPFVKMRDAVYVTHAPCENRHIGKLDKVSLRQQRYMPVADDLLERVYGEADRGHPTHIFGHIAMDRPLEYGNKIGLDTGGVYGNAFSWWHWGKVRSVAAAATHSVNRLLEVDAPEKDFGPLEPHEEQRVEYAVRQRINFVSGTIAPTASDRERGKIEPIETAIARFRSGGVDVIHAQKKYMGSRCEAYISRDPAECMLTSRNGFRIRQLHTGDGETIRDLTPVYEAILAQPKIATIFERFPDADTLVLDGELMPWYAMGKPLIESQYRVIERAAGSEFELLRQTGFEELLEAERGGELFAAYTADPRVPDSTVNPNKKATFKLLRNYRHVPIAEMESYLGVYRRQLDLYGTAREVEYCPFDILKIIHRDGSETLFRDMPVAERYGMVARDEGLLVDLRDETQVAELVAHFASLAEDTEGLVLKCNRPGRSRVSMLKVRNERYLTLIYGFDYLEPGKYASLVEKKHVTRKLAVANREYDLGWELVSIPRREITPENAEYRRVLSSLIFEERKETELDPRL